MKVCTPDRLAVEIDAPTGRRYNFRNGIADVHPADAKAIIREGGFIPSLNGVVNSDVGWVCKNCDFGSYFRKCSRCGTVN